MRPLISHSKVLHVSASLVILLAVGACGNEDGDKPLNAQEARSDKQRITTPQVAQSDLAAQVAGNSAFAFDLYQKLRKTSGNLFYSPHSMSLALAMTHAGARNNTEAEMAQVLGYLPQSRLHAALNLLDLELAKRGKGASGTDGQPFRLHIVNATWGQKDHRFLPTYLDTLALNYDAGLRLMDFATQPEQSRLEINAWVQRQTEDRIKDLLPPNSITEITRLVLTNAIYFNASWKTPFDPDATATETFTTQAGQQVQVPMMNGSLNASYLKGADFAAAALPYDGDEISMLIIVPDAGKLDSVEASLDSAKVQTIVTGLARSELRLKLPKFEFETPLLLKDHLQALGIKDAFSTTAADFSGIDGSRELSIGQVIHKAFVKVDEAGTEAAAATAVVMPGSATPNPPKTLHVNRPFIFLIRDHATNAVLFVGRVVDPS